MGAMAYGNYGEIDKQNKWNEGKIRLNILVKAAEENAVLEFAKPQGKYQFTATEEFIKDCKEAVRNPEKFDVNFLGEGGASFKNKWKGKKPIAYVKDGQKHHVLWNALEKTGSEAGDYNMGSTGGSGAGAKNTAFFEGAVCWYGAIAFANSSKLADDFRPTPQHISSVSKDVFTDQSWQAIEEFLIADEEDHITKRKPDKCHRRSVIRQVNMLWEKHGITNHYQWFRGTDLVKQIEAVYTICNGNHYDPPKNDDDDSEEKKTPFSDVNKWNPSDIWMCDCKASWPLVTKHKMFHEFNNELIHLFDEKKLIGVSLKKVETDQVPYAKYNFVNKRPFVTADDWYAKSFDSIDVYLKCSPDGRVKGISAPAEINIQYRDTSGKGSAYQGEVLGMAAKHGKCGGNVTNMILQYAFHGLHSIWGDYNGATDVRDKAKLGNVEDKIWKLANTYKKRIKSFEKTVKVGKDTTKINTLDKDWIEAQSTSWKMSKYIGLHLIKAFNQASAADRSAALTSIFLYATSQMEFSGPFIKIGSG
tara:strand:+ start:115 stop:1707 length:1593 start_codon:yes stop_codon:yes gene_type:complete